MIRHGVLIAQGVYSAWQAPALQDLEPVLTTILSEAPHGIPGDGVEAARAEVASRVLSWQQRMWSAFAFGIDAEGLDENGE